MVPHSNWRFTVVFCHVFVEAETSKMYSTQLWTKDALFVVDEMRAVLAGYRERGEDVRRHRSDSDVSGTHGRLRCALVRAAQVGHGAACEAVSLHDVA